jgi:peptidoglycan/xylan/chitin deacetylase (PgdA/CDA1 family)
MMNKLLILNYHSIYNSSDAEFCDPIYSIDVFSFRQQLEVIKKLELEVILISDLNKIKLGTKPFIAITIDDGHDSDYKIAYRILNEYGFKATFYLPTFKLQQDPLKIEHYQNILSKGHDIGPHGKTHKYLSDLNYDDQFKELHESKETIEIITRKKADYFALPGGKYSNETLEISKMLGYKALLTTNFGFIDLNREQFLFNRWTIKKSTSIDVFEKVLQGNWIEVKKQEGKSFLKSGFHMIFSNRMADYINYKLRG